VRLPRSLLVALLAALVAGLLLGPTSPGFVFAVAAAAALLTAPNGMDSVQEALALFVTAPTNYAFKRPLGEI